MGNNDEFDYQIEDRERYVREIVESNAKKKIVVSGPGTGKTYLFERVLKEGGFDESNALVITFINHLCNDLEIILKDMSQVKTFHTFSLGILYHEDPGYKFYENLSKVCESDYEIINGKKLIKDFDDCLRSLDNENGLIDFYIERAEYYRTIFHDYYVYKIMKLFENRPESIPEKYGIILVDEYQDFCKLEVEVIDKLSTKSPIIIVGDDDQAIYDMRQADKEYIRIKARSDEFSLFELPYCSRCPSVIVDAINDIIKIAQSKGYLQGRVDKKFIPFFPDNIDINRKYPKIIHAKCSVHTKRAPYVAKYIHSELGKIDEDEEVLIIGPKHYLKLVDEYFKKEDIPLDYDPIEPSSDVKLIDSIKFLLADRESNIGWRIILEKKEITNFENIIKYCYKNNENLVRRAPAKEVHYVNKLLDILDCILNIDEVLAYFECSKKELFGIIGNKGEKVSEEDVRDIQKSKIKMRTYQGCKGLDADYVFIIGLNKNEIPGNQKYGIDHEISKFIVSLTRAKKKCYLISNFRFAGIQTGGICNFIDWIDDDRIHIEDVNKDYWQR